MLPHIPIPIISNIHQTAWLPMSTSERFDKLICCLHSVPFQRWIGFNTVVCAGIPRDIVSSKLTTAKSGSAKQHSTSLTWLPTSTCMLHANCLYLKDTWPVIDIANFWWLECHYQNDIAMHCAALLSFYSPLDLSLLWTQHQKLYTCCQQHT